MAADPIVPVDFQRRDDLERWQHYIAARPDTHYSDQGQWRLLFQELYGFPHYSFAYVDGGVTRGVASIYLIASPFFGRLMVTSPFFGYGGLYGDTADIRDALRERIEQAGREVGADFIEFRLRQPLPRPYEQNTDFLEFDLDLGDSAEALWQRLASNVRQNIRKSRRHALAFSISDDPGPSYALVSQTVRDLGTPLHSHRFFELVRKYFPDDAHFCEVHRDEVLVAGGLMVRYRDSLATPYIGSLKRWRFTSANYCQYWGIVEHCLQVQVRRFELGRSPKHSTHVQFKTKWAAEPVPIYYSYLRLKPGKQYKYSVAQAPRSFVMASAAWKRMPLWLTRRLGHRFARYIP